LGHRKDLWDLLQCLVSRVLHLPSCISLDLIGSALHSISSAQPNPNDRSSRKQRLGPAGYLGQPVFLEIHSTPVQIQQEFIECFLSTGTGLG
jgi:hypothetical protein